MRALIVEASLLAFMNATAVAPIAAVCVWVASLADTSWH